MTVVVERCENCAEPTARLSGPNSFRAPCDEDGQFSTIFIGSDGSGDPSGRPLQNRIWGIKTGEHDNDNGRSLTCADPTPELEDLVRSSKGLVLCLLEVPRRSSLLQYRHLVGYLHMIHLPLLAFCYHNQLMACTAPECLQGFHIETGQQRAEVLEGCYVLHHHPGHKLLGS